MDFLVRFLSRISRSFNWDLLYRIISRLPLKDRRTLLFRLLGQEAESVTFERDQNLWTGYAWDESTSWTLFVDGVDAGQEVRSVLSWMKNQGRLNSPRDYIIEVGANIGITTIPLAEQSEQMIVAIEPSPESFTLLKQNIAQNGLQDRVISIPKAVLDKKGPAKLGLQSGATGGAEIEHQNCGYGLEVKGHQLGEIIEVEGDTITTLLTDQKISPHQVAFVWSDIQGSEIYLIQHGELLWSAGVPLYLEIEPVLLKQRTSIDSLIKLIETHFHSFIEIHHLIEKGARAEQIQISRIIDIFQQHDNDHSHTEILLIPKGSSA